MLDVHILFLIVNCGQVCARIFALIFSGQPISACGTCGVAIAIKETPARLTDVLKKQRQRRKDRLYIVRTYATYHFKLPPTVSVSGNKPDTKNTRTLSHDCDVINEEYKGRKSKKKCRL